MGMRDNANWGSYPKVNEDVDMYMQQCPTCNKCLGCGVAADVVLPL
jgi:hypothetical protein